MSIAASNQGMEAVAVVALNQLSEYINFLTGLPPYVYVCHICLSYFYAIQFIVHKIAYT